MSDDLKTLFPGREVTLTSGVVIMISPFEFGQLPKVAKGFALIQSKIQGGNLVEIAAAGGEELLDLLALAVGKPPGGGDPRKWLNGLPSDDGLNLLAAVIEVNRDFFVQRMSPILQKLTRAMTGAPSLPDSSTAVIDGQTSSTTA